MSKSTGWSVDAAQEPVARGVGADLVEQLLEGDHLARALAHPHGLAVAEQVDELADDHVELPLVPERRARGLHAGDVAVVVGAPDVDDAVEAAVELVLVVGDVGGEVRVVAVGLDEHAVLVVTEVGRAEPHRALVLVDVAGLAQRGDRANDRGLTAGALLVQRALREPHVEVHAHAVQHVLEVLEHRRRTPAP